MPKTLPLPRWSLFAIVPLAILMILVVGSVADALAHAGHVGRNVVVAGDTVGGLGDDDLNERLDVIADRYAQRQVAVNLGEGALLETTAGDVGLGVDVEATAQAVRDAGKRNPFNIAGFVSSLFGTRTANLAFTTDESMTRQFADSLPSVDAVEPTITVADGEIIVDEGSPGRMVDPRTVVEALAAEADDPLGAIELDVAWTTIAQQRSPSAVLAVRDELIAGIGDGVAVTISDPSPPEASAGGEADAGTSTDSDGGAAVDTATDSEQLPPGSAVVSAGTVVSWLVLDDDGSDITWSIDEEAAIVDLERLIGLVAPENAEYTFDIVDGEVTVIATEGAEICCAPGSGAVIEAAIRDGVDDIARLPLRVAEADEALAAATSLGIVEVVGEFTTNHRCCEGRVTNIHRISDLVRGYVILPGEELSINGFIGRRTQENGFVPAGVIQNGVFEDDVGGGISQFATTLFNAAFFGGLDFGEYQSHSLYISRYPYGREATLSFPHPDLQIRNTTEYGVLVWPTYTDTSITIRLYSTKHIVVEELGQTSRAQGECTRVTTSRRRTYPDGEVVDDSVIAVYRPGEGFDCNGNRTVPEAELPPTTTAVPTTIPETTVPATTTPGTTAVPTTAPPTTAPPTTAPPTTAPPTTAPPTTAPPTTAPPTTAPPTTAPPTTAPQSTAPPSSDP